MGTFSTALFSDDVACDVRDEFVHLLASCPSADDATRAVIQSWASSIDDCDDGPVFWLALAATQWKYGCLSSEVQTRAIDVIDNGLDLGRWEGPRATRRKAVLNALKEKLLSSQPALRRPPRRKPVVPASTKVPSLDGSALATAFELGPSSIPNAPRMQVMVEVVVDGTLGGGGVFVADCDFSEVTLDWLDSDTLQISYPSSATPSSKSPSLFSRGRIVQVRYRTKTA